MNTSEPVRLNLKDKLIILAKGTGLIVGTLVLAAIFTNVNPMISMGILSIAAWIGLIAFFKPLPRFGLPGKKSAAILLGSAILSFSADLEVYKQNQSAELAKLRQENPTAYLDQLKTTDKAKWEKELMLLDPQGFAKYEADRAEIARRLEEEKLEAQRKAAAEKAEADRKTAEMNKVRIENLLEYVKSIPAENITKNLEVYEELERLAPGEKVYMAKADNYRGRKIEFDRMVRSPEQYLEISKFTWSTGGFGSVMKVNLTFKNKLPFDVKDAVITCELAGPSGTAIDTNTETIYEIFPAGKTKTIREFNMGFIKSQSKSAGCRVEKVSR